MSAGRTEPVPVEELKARALELGRVPVADDEARGHQVGLVILRLGQEWYGISAALIQEVVSAPLVTPLPLTPPLVAGAMNLRGEILGVLDLATLLGLPPSGQPQRLAVVARCDNVSAALLADGVEDVQWFARAKREPVLPTVSAAGARFLLGAYRPGTRLITELNIDEVLNHPQLRPLRDGRG